MKVAPIRLNAYSVIERAVEEGINFGWRRAHKHTDDPDEETLREEISRAVMICITEVIKFDD